MFGVSPSANCSCRLPPPIVPTTTSPVCIPTRTARWMALSCFNRVLSHPMASTMDRPARTARRTSSSCARG